MTLRNSEYEIEIRHANGRVYYTYRKVNGQWQQDVVNGKVHAVTAEQLLNHLLPALAGVKPGVEAVVRYVPDAAPQS